MKNSIITYKDENTFSIADPKSKCLEDIEFEKYQDGEIEITIETKKARENYMIPAHIVKELIKWINEK